MKIHKKILAIIFLFAMAGTSYAAKWQTMTFDENIQKTLDELNQYCIVRDMKLEDVLWANKTSESELKAGQVIYLPANHADMLAIWQNVGAWQPTALVPVNSAAAANRLTGNTNSPKRTTTSLSAIAAVTPTPKVESASVRTESAITAPKVETAQVTPVPTVQPAKAPPSPANVIKETAKPDKILTARPKKTQPEIPGLMDPIIILSPNGDPTHGPMRLMISGDKVEVVRLPQNAVPKQPSIADLDHTFGTTPDYLKYDVSKLPKTNNYIPRMNGKMMWPVDGKISSPFGKVRGNHKHQGIDIPMPQGTPIRAANTGVVARTGNNNTMGFRGYGNFVLLDHGGGVQSFYAHCLSTTVKEGQRVMQGQIIGYVGCTGRSTANHLHFEIRVNDTKVDPMQYLGGNQRLAATSR